MTLQHYLTHPKSKLRGWYKEDGINFYRKYEQKRRGGVKHVGTENWKKSNEKTIQEKKKGKRVIKEDPLYVKR